jgi:hypothetical protein
MGVKGKINGAVAKLGARIGIAWALARVRDAAEGRLGPEWKARYWALAGKKTYTGVAFALAAVVPFALGYDQVAEVVAVIAGVAISAGVLDKAWRTARPAWLTENPVYRFLAAHSALLTLAFSTAFALLQAGYCAGIECGTAIPILLGLSAIATWAGLLDAAWKAAPPILQRHDGRWEIHVPDEIWPEWGLIVDDSPEKVRAAWDARQASDGRSGG